MGHKVNPFGFRLGINKYWLSNWYNSKNYYSKWIGEDYLIREFINNKFLSSSISSVLIERSENKCKIIINSAKPGILIGKKGLGIERIKNNLSKITSQSIILNIYEIKKPETDAKLTADSIAQQIEKRVPYKRVMKKAILIAKKHGISGVKIMCSGRLGGAEMSRREWYIEGRVPLHTIRSNIDYGLSVAKTIYGTIGCKVWFFKGYN